MASPFNGGPERQVIGLARGLPREIESIFLSFAEHGRAQAFLSEVRRNGLEGKTLFYNTPHYFRCVDEVAGELRRANADLVCCSGYKPDLVGWRAARRVGIPVISISHGWTSATWKVRGYEKLDKIILRWMDAVICVSSSQADKVRCARVPESRIVVIQNAIGEEAFVEPTVEHRKEMLDWFRAPPRWIVGAAGRFSPEKGFTVFLEAAAHVLRRCPEAGFVLFGDGPLRKTLEKQIAEQGLEGRIVLGGFKHNLCQYLPNLDLHVMSSFTEGLPVILLEACAAGVATVSTAVGGIPEVLDDGQSGFLVKAGDAKALADRIAMLLSNGHQRKQMSAAARARVRRDFSFQEMSHKYHEVFRCLVNR